MHLGFSWWPTPLGATVHLMTWGNGCAPCFRTIRARDTNVFSQDHSLAATSTRRWLPLSGWRHTARPYGVRIPNTSERGRAMGLLPYLRTLGLTGAQLYDAQGNAFDRCIVGLRLGPTIARWLAGGDVPVHHYPSPQAILATYRRVYNDRHAAGWRPPMENPVPPAVRVGGEARQINLAAEDGRRDQ